MNELETIFKEKFGQNKTLGFSSKVDWSEAPHWANWCAQSADGMWDWFSTKPKAYDFGLYVKGSFMASGKGKQESMSSTTHIVTRPNPDWKKTIEKRPSQPVTNKNND